MYTTTYVVLSTIIPGALILNYFEKLKVIFCVRGVRTPNCENHLNRPSK